MRIEPKPIVAGHSAPATNNPQTSTSEAIASLALLRGGSNLNFDILQLFFT